MYKDKILCYNRDVRQRFNTINKKTGQVLPFSDFVPGSHAVLNKDTLVYIGDGKFRKLALEPLPRPVQDSF
ncbi:MAG: hypothetical protein IPN46_12490 [Saprospiraceae bacterium]|nr:hypothetical protein [Saprospiraceae bacterium]